MAEVAAMEEGKAAGDPGTVILTQGKSQVFEN